MLAKTNCNRNISICVVDFHKPKKLTSRNLLYPQPPDLTLFFREEKSKPKFKVYSNLTLSTKVFCILLELVLELRETPNSPQLSFSYPISNTSYPQLTILPLITTPGYILATPSFVRLSPVACACVCVCVVWVGDKKLGLRRKIKVRAKLGTKF